MSAVVAVPELMAQAATELATVGSNLSAAHMTAAGATLTVLPAAADEVSASVAHLFSGHATEYQKLAGKAAAFHEQFVQHLTASAGSYASAEAANVSLLQPLTASADAAASIPLPDTLFNSIYIGPNLITLLLFSPSQLLFVILQQLNLFDLFYLSYLLVVAIPFLVLLQLLYGGPVRLDFWRVGPGTF